MATVLHRGFSPSSILLLLLLLVVARSSAAPIHDILKKYGLPQGLLPDNANNYSLSSDGDLVVYLDGPCCVRFDTVFRYETTIRGKLKSGQISELSGIQFQMSHSNLVPITNVINQTDDILFAFITGMPPVTISADYFEEIPSCMANVDPFCERFEWSLPISQV